MDDDMKFHQTWHLHQLPSFYQQFLFIFYSVYKNKPRGVSVKDLIKFIKRNYYLDGDMCPQMVTVLQQAIDQGVIEERCEKYHLVGPIASVQNTVPDSTERRNELRNIYGVFNYTTTKAKSKSRNKTRERDSAQRSRNNSKDSIKLKRPESAKSRCGSREKCSSVGLALQERTLTDALQSKIPEPKICDNSIAAPSKYAPNITVLSKIKQYFETSVCKCQSRTSSRSKSKTKSSLSKPSSDSKTSGTTMLTATQNSNHSKNNKEILLKSGHDSTSDDFLSIHSKSDRPKDCKSGSLNSKSPNIGNSSQGISLQATRSKTPTQYTMLPSRKPSDIRSTASNYSNANNKSVHSYFPIISTFQHYLGCNDCNVESIKPHVTPTTRTLRPRTGSRVVSPQKRMCKRKKSPKRLNVRFRTMGRDRCSGQFCSLQRKDSKCKTCKVRISRPTTANSSRPCTRNSYAATRQSMRTRSSTRGRCASAYSSKAGSVARSSISNSVRRIKAKRKKKNTCSVFKKPAYKKRKLESRDSYYGESYWGDFCT